MFLRLSRRTVLRSAARTGALATAVGALLLGSDVRAAGVDPLFVHRVLSPTGSALALRGKTTALVEVPDESAARAAGVRMVAPGYGVLDSDAATLSAYRALFPHARAEMGLRVRPALDKVNVAVRSDLARAQGHDGTGVIVGVVDSGIDVMHPDFTDDAGNTRIAWLLDYSQAPVGLHPDLEAIYASGSGATALGAVLSAADIDAIRAGKSPLPASASVPADETGHGTHVTGIAAASPHDGSPYTGMAPKSTLVIVKGTDDTGEFTDSNNILRGVAFVFDRAAFLGMPAVVNLSLATNMAPHDGTTLFEEAIASQVGGGGRAIVVAAGNFGDISAAYHTSVYVPPGVEVRVPITSAGAIALSQGSQSVQGMVTMHAGDDLQVGLDSTEGRWITPIGQGSGSEATVGDADGYVVFDDTGNLQAGSGSPIALFGWGGAWPSGTYAITLKGHGTAEIYMDPTVIAAPDPSNPSGALATFTWLANGSREGTIGVPATHPALIAVGCTANRSTLGTDPASLQVQFDVPGGVEIGDPSGATVVPGQQCSFSSAGPTTTGLAKPDVAAPGFGVISALSAEAIPGQSAVSIFTCSTGPADGGCYVIDPLHAVTEGTSQSSPVVAGIAALLFQESATLTQSQIRTYLQAGVHRFRSSTRFFHAQSGPGEVDALGALAALADDESPSSVAPSSSTSWLSVSNDYAEPGGRPIEALLIARSDADGPADGVASDSVAPLTATVSLDGVALDAPALTRQGPGLYQFSFIAPAGSEGSELTFGATYGGASIVSAITLPIAVDSWHARYPTTSAGGCNVAEGSGEASLFAAALALAAAASLAWSRRARRAVRT